MSVSVKETSTAVLANSQARARRIVLLGATGSIGTSTAAVVRALGPRCELVGLSTHGNLRRLEELIHEFKPEVVSVWSDADAAALRAKAHTSRRGTPLQVLSGIEGLCELAAWPEADSVLSSVVGAVGLKPLITAIRTGKTVALANKEALVMAGELVMSEVRKHGATLLPVDSEHSAIFQCLLGHPASGIKRLVLTASGGPFYRFTGALDSVTVEQALAHPTWKMGKKITIDSATLMNKGLETIEASILFGLPIDQVDILIHPQSIVHSLVEFQDGAMLAQLSLPDMSLPIQFAITYPQRTAGPTPALDLAKARSLDFFEPDFSRFPCLTLARAAARAGGTSPAVMNAADEVAVHAFLSGRLRFTEISEVIEQTLARHERRDASSLAEVLDADAWAREMAQSRIDHRKG